MMNSVSSRDYAQFVPFSDRLFHTVGSVEILKEYSVLVDLLHARADLVQNHFLIRSEWIGQHRGYLYRPYGDW